MEVHTFIADSANEAVERIRAELGPAAVVLSVRKLPRNGLDRFLKQDQIEVVARIEKPAEPQRAEPLDPLADLREEIRQLRQQVSVNQNLEVTSTAPQNNAVSSRIKNSLYSASAGNLREPKPQPALPNAFAPERKASGISHLLVQTGLLPAYAEMIAQEIPATEAQSISEQIQGATNLLGRKWQAPAVQSDAGAHVYVGVPGSGKSTVLCKMLAQTTLVEGQPASVYQLDSHVANVSSLPGVYAEIVGAQFERSFPLQFERREGNVYIDLPGVPVHNAKALGHLRDLLQSFGMPEVHLVLNGAYESAHLLEQVRFFSSLGITDLVLTHLDEESRWGKVWNLVLGTNYCVRSISCGQNIPGEFHPANPEVVLARQFRGI